MTTIVTLIKGYKLGLIQLKKVQHKLSQILPSDTNTIRQLLKDTIAITSGLPKSQEYHAIKSSINQKLYFMKLNIDTPNSYKKYGKYHHLNDIYILHDFLNKSLNSLIIELNCFVEENTPFY